MPIFIWGRKAYAEELGYLVQECPQCRTVGPFRVVETKKKFTVYFVPTFSYSRKIYLLCPACQASFEVPAEHVDRVTASALSQSELSALVRALGESRQTPLQAVAEITTPTPETVVAHLVLEARFDGYWSTAQLTRLPSEVGVYLVYAGTRHEDITKVRLSRLIYVGYGQDIRSDIGAAVGEFSRHLLAGEELFFAYAAHLQAHEAERIRAALAFEHKPPANDPAICNRFPYEPCEVRVSGKCVLVKEFIKVP